MSLERAEAPDPYDLLPPVPSFTVTSTDVTDGQPLDELFAHTSVGGKNLSPHLAWSGFPDETRGFVVTCYDPDAPTGSGFWHWVLVNLPVGVTELERAIDVDALEVGADATPAYVGFNLAFHTLARATIRPTFQVRG
jgi:phosphatidylethanolamine-binding protein (PEBP) family uncharacterized protein